MTKIHIKEIDDSDLTMLMAEFDEMELDAILKYNKRIGEIMKEQEEGAE